MNRQKTGLWKKLLLSLCVAAGGLILLPMTLDAEEVTLKDMGNGFYLPTSFELRDSDGSLRTSPKIDPALFEAGSCQDEERTTLDNGMTAVKWWMDDGSGNGTGFPC